MKLIRSAAEEGVLTLSLNRAEKKNAVNGELLVELESHLDRAAADASLRAVIVRGEGGCFCAGADLRELTNFSPEAMRAFHDLRERVLAKLEELPCPTFAAIEGFALGTGLELALSTDFRVAAEGAALGVPSSLLGIVESHHYLARLVRSAGLSRARFLVLTGQRIGAAEACAWGLVEKVFPDGELPGRVAQLAQAIAGHAPASVRLSKRILGECDRDPYLREVADPGGAMAGAAGGAEMREGTAAFVEKRRARFPAPD
ncbi:MAG: enoyl-CoA hydratase/isomerase family protein [Thermodesulfobacteriota bacterium]